MIRKHIILILLLQCIAASPFAQSAKFTNIPVKKGPLGVYFFAGDLAAKGIKLSEIYRKYQRLEGQFSTGDKNFQTVTTLTQPGSYEELVKRIGKEEVEKLKEILEEKNNEVLLRKLQDLNMGSVLLYMDKNFSRVMGLTGFAPYGKKKPTAYRLIGVTPEGKNDIIYSLTDADIPAPDLPKAFLATHTINDSIVNLTWTVPKSYAGIAQYASVYKMTNNKFEKVYTLLLGNSNDESVVKYNYTEFVAPDNFYKYYITVEDYAGNAGPASDTANMLAVSSRQIKSIKNFSLKDSAGDVRLSWNGIPDKGYFSAIEVSKSRNALTGFVVLDTIPITDTAYIDQHIIPGTLYYYSIRALAYPFTYINALPSATANINIENINSNPFAPTNIKATNEGKNVRLSWDDNPELDLYAYFVYRGTNANNMEQVSGIVQQTSWLDTSVNLSGLTTYTYGVKVMNRGQAMSDLGQPVYIKPARETTVPAIGGITGIKKEAGYELQWENIAENFPTITGYILLRKGSDEKEFMPVSQKIIQGSYYIDSSVLKTGIKYEYTVAALDYNGNVGQLSPSIFYAPQKTLPQAPASFTAYLQNGKVTIKWPVEVGIKENKKYNVYRKSATDKGFTLIGTSTSNMITDDHTIKGILYTYAITVFIDGLESEKSMTQSVRAL